MAEQVPGHWTRVQSVVCESGLPGVLAMTGTPAMPAELAEAEVPKLKQAGARVLRDLGGYPCIHLADPAVVQWAAGLDERVTVLAADIEREMEASRGGG